MDSHDGTKGTKDMHAQSVEAISAEVVDAAFHLHRRVGPGLLESVYEALLAEILGRRGLRVQRQVLVEFKLDGIHFHEGRDGGPSKLSDGGLDHSSACARG